VNEALVGRIAKDKDSMPALVPTGEKEDARDIWDYMNFYINDKTFYFTVSYPPNARHSTSGDVKSAYDRF